MKIEMSIPESFELTKLLLITKQASEQEAKRARGHNRKRLKACAIWSGHFIRKIADAGAKEIDARKGGEK